MSAFVLDIRGVPEVRAMLEQVEGAKLNARMRRGLRAGAKVMREELRSQASGRADLPRTFRKTRTRAHRNPLGVSVSPASPLSNIFEHGAKRHPVGTAGQLLVNAATGFAARGPVSHPGMAARPLIAPVFEAAKERASDALERTLFEGI